MNLQRYSLTWTDKLIRRTEIHLQDICSAVHKFYQEKGYPIRAPQHSSAPEKVDDTVPNEETEAEVSYKESCQAGEATFSSTSPSLEDVVNLAGSFPLRTSVYRTPFSEVNAVGGDVGADLVITIPSVKCTLADLQSGEYLNRRASFLSELGDYFQKLAQEAALWIENKKRPDPCDDDMQNAQEDNGDHTALRDEQAVLERFSRMEVIYTPIHGCYSMGAEKQILQLRFRRRCHGEQNSYSFSDRSSSSAQSLASALSRKHIHEVFCVNLHLRCAFVSGRVMSAIGIRKHPYYSHLVLEDYMMPHYLRKLHTLCVNSGALRRAIVILKCWAHHMGLMASSSGHSEGLNGFILAAMVLHMLEEGNLSSNMTEENVVRTVWVRMTHGYFTPASAASPSTPSLRPAIEERGNVAVLRLQGEVMNVLFRTSSSFFRTVIQRAAEDTLTYRSPLDVFAEHPFQLFQLHHDVALMVSGNWHDRGKPRHNERQIEPQHVVIKNGDNIDEENHDRRNINSCDKECSVDVKKASIYFAPLVEKANAVREVLKTALGSRARNILVWITAPDKLHVPIHLSNESEGRSHLIRGPPIEHAEAVADFNAFWGMDITSTRQFPDGGIHRCVLWRLAEQESLATLTNSSFAKRTITPLSASVVLRHVVQYALRKHVQPDTTVSVLLGGFEAFLAERIGAEWRDALPLMQGSLYQASRDVEQMITELPKSVLPCKVTDFSFVAATERGTEVFPVRPHLALTYTTDHHYPLGSGEKDFGTQDDHVPRYGVVSTVPSIVPIYAVLSIDDKGKIPDTLEAIEMMRGAICAQLAKFINQRLCRGIASLSCTDDPLTDPTTLRNKEDKDANRHSAVLAFATKRSVDIIYKGYLFRIFVSHYREVSLLRTLQRNAEANAVEQKLFWAPQHAKYLSSIVYGHQSYAKATRLAKRWLSAMLLYEFVLPEAVELLVAHAYLSENTHVVPKTAVTGFLSFIQLLATHDWSKPLILNFTDDSKTAAEAANVLRKLGPQQAMFIATPYAPTTSPFTQNTPRPMIMSRLIQLANGALSLMINSFVRSGGTTNNLEDIEAEVFHTSSLPFDFALRLHPQLVLHLDRALWQRGAGLSQELALTPRVEHPPKIPVSDKEILPLSNTGVRRIWMLDELNDKEQVRRYVLALAERDPAAHAVQTMRTALGDQAMFFYDALSPLYVYIVSITQSHVLEHSQAMQDKLIRVCRGAVLSLPEAVAFNRTNCIRDIVETKVSGSFKSSKFEAKTVAKRTQAPKKKQHNTEKSETEANGSFQSEKDSARDRNTSQVPKGVEPVQSPKPHFHQSDKSAKSGTQHNLLASGSVTVGIPSVSRKQSRDRVALPQPDNEANVSNKKNKKRRISSGVLATNSEK